MKHHKPILTYPPLAGAVFLAATLASYAAADYPTTVLSQGPVGYWRLNETTPVVQVSDVANNRGSLGTAENGVYGGDLAGRGVDGAVAGDTAAAFDGATEYVDVPYNVALNPAANFSIEAWLAPYANDSQCTLCCGDFASPRSGWLIYQSGLAGWNFRMYNQNGLNTSLNLVIPCPITGDYQHLVVTYDGTTVRAYTNGVFAISATPTSYVPGTAGSFRIGSRNDGLNFAWPGQADEVAFYQEATGRSCGASSDSLADHSCSVTVAASRSLLA